MLYLSGFELFSRWVLLGCAIETVERSSITFTSNGKRELVPRGSLPLTCRLLFIISTHKLVVSCTDFLSTRIVLICFYLLIFCFEKFST